MEIKSGKTYARHNALSNLLKNPKYDIPKALVFYNGNVQVREKVHYLPIYMLMFLQKEALPQDLIYKPDLDILK